MADRGQRRFWGICQLPPTLDSANRSAIRDDAEHDMLLALERWVEHGIAPDKIIATKYVDGKPIKGVDRTWLLCPYPDEARWTGKGNASDAANFICQMPENEH